MATLKNIKISNIRRFGKDVSIPISPQASIILAPNGTGKTSLFEAIELAITGRVERLENELIALIKDTHNFADVCLDFGDFQQAASLTSAGRVEWTPEPKIFGQAKEEDVSYLLRLTHLLDQRDKHWFIQEEAKTAGALLSKLPIGQEAQRVDSLKTKLTRSAKKLIEAKEQDIENLKTKRDHWNELLSKRLQTKKRFGSKVLPFEKISQKLQQFAEKVEGLDNIERVSTEHHICKSNFDSKLKSVQSDIVNLSQATGLLEQFKINKTSLEKLRTDKKELLITKEQFQNERDIQVLNVSKAQEVIRELDDAIEKHRKELKKLEKAIELSDTLIHKKDKLVDVVKQFNKAKALKEKSKSNLDILEKDTLKHSSWEAKQSDWVRKEGVLSKAEKDLTQWTFYNNELNTLYKSMLLLNQKIESYNEQEAENNAKLSNAKQKISENNLHIESLKKTSDQVRAAVSAIAANISGKQGKCPVCGENHGVDELKRRLEAQLIDADPELNRLYSHDVELKNELNKIEMATAEFQKEFSSVFAEANSNQENISSLEQKVRQVRSNPTFNFKEIEEASAIVKAMKREQLELKSHLDNEHQLLPKNPGSEQLLQERVHLEQVIDSFNQNQNALVELQKNIESLQQEQSALNATISPYEDKETLTQKILKFVEKAEKEKQTEKACKKQIHYIDDNVSALESRISRLTSEMRQVEESVTTFLKKWRLLGFDEEPSQKSMSLKLESLEKEKVNIEESLQKLDELRKEIAAFQSSKALQEIQKDIDDVRKGTSEEAYSTDLNKKIEQTSDLIEKLKLKKSTLDYFYNALNDEINNIQSKVESIEPLWRSLLNRVVREQRFSKTGLEFTKKYNKAHAMVSVPISRASVSASKVASEAQKTDLQLTFLLSMALASPWSPWKALLLDDPTQHHDLVHASAIFDLLRDYISEYGFQLIVTTHDPVQANFLRRKLESDGIEVKIIELVPSSGGVKAICDDAHI